jgi:hypothetical protein
VVTVGNRSIPRATGDPAPRVERSTRQPSSPVQAGYLIGDFLVRPRWSSSRRAALRFRPTEADPYRRGRSRDSMWHAGPAHAEFQPALRWSASVSPLPEGKPRQVAKSRAFEWVLEREARGVANKSTERLPPRGWWRRDVPGVVTGVGIYRQHLAIPDAYAPAVVGKVNWYRPRDHQLVCGRRRVSKRQLRRRRSKVIPQRRGESYHATPSWVPVERRAPLVGAGSWRGVEAVTNPQNTVLRH